MLAPHRPAVGPVFLAKVRSGGSPATTLTPRTSARPDPQEREAVKAPGRLRVSPEQLRSKPRSLGPCPAPCKADPGSASRAATKRRIPRRCRRWRAATTTSAPSISPVSRQLLRADRRGRSGRGTTQPPRRARHPSQVAVHIQWRCGSAAAQIAPSGPPRPMPRRNAGVPIAAATCAAGEILHTSVPARPWVHPAVWICTNYLAPDIRYCR
jgi:hypothetical protein